MSELKSKKIAIDIDEVLYPLVEYVLEYVEQASGRKVTREELYDDQEYTASGLYFKDFSNHVVAFQNTPESLEPEPLEGALEVIRKLHIQSSLWLLTSRGVELEDMTRTWVERHIGMDYFEDLIFSGNHWRGNEKETKATVCERIGADFLIEDQPRHVSQFEDHPTQAILFGEYEWNRDYDSEHAYRARNWDEVYEYIKKFL